MTFSLRKATLNDIDEIAVLISKSVRSLSQNYYDAQQIELSVKSVFGVDRELIGDETYFVAETDDRIVGCGGWSKRKTLYGASHYEESRDSEELDPETDAAKIRAFFIHPDAARKGIGSAILRACEDEARSLGFRSAEMMSTLPGVPLYSACGYSGDERIEIPVGDGVTIDCIRMSKSLL
jgi:N-acetylglutamate synthase-like GNAT family acetyltransferase